MKRPKRKAESNMHLQSKFLSLAIAALFILMCTVPCFSAVGESSIELATYSERYLSDSVLATGGSLSFDGEGNVVFSVSNSRNSMRFKCNGEAASGEQNAVCIRLRNETASEKLTVETVFMNYDLEEFSYRYDQEVERNGNDSYIFIPNMNEQFIVSVTVKATGAVSGSITVMGMWHCYYYFGMDGSSKNIGNLSTVKYENGGDSVLLEGTILHDVTISSKNSKINVYRLLPGEEIDPAFIASHEPCASSGMSRSFSFSIKNKTGGDYVSAYAVVLVSEEGELEYVIEDKKYPETAYDKDISVGFKGIATGLEYYPSKVYAGAILIDVFFDELINNGTGGYLYSFGGSNYCFNSEVVHSLDRRMTSLASSGGSAMLRIATRAGSLFGSSYKPNEESARITYAAIAFLCERYEESIFGIVLGNDFDTPNMYSGSSKVAYGEYIDGYSDYISIVMAAARNTDPSVNIIVPVSSNNSRVYGEDGEDGKYPMSAMLISLFRKYSESGNGIVTLMVNDDVFPDVKGNMTKKSQTSGDITAYNDDIYDERVESGEIMNITSENTKVFEDLISFISKRLGLVDTKYIFSWSPEATRSAEELELAYVYTYFNLCANPNIHSFVCDITKTEEENYRCSEKMFEALSIMGGTGAKAFADSLAVKNKLLPWHKISGYANYKPVFGDVSMLNVYTSLDPNVKGSISFVDFNSSSSVARWKKGAYLKSISIHSVSDSRTVLKSVMKLPANSSEFAELIYSFSEEIKLFPIDVIEISFMIESPSGAHHSDYTVNTIIGGSFGKSVAEVSVPSNESGEIRVYIDTSSFGELATMSYIKFCLQNESRTDDEIVLRIASVKGHSSMHTSEELADLIDIDPNGGETGMPTLKNDRNSMVWTLMLFAVAVMSVLAVVLHKRVPREK